MNDPLLGCPHCGKPVGFAPSMSGHVVACPHCRGQFQMPDRPPSQAPVRNPSHDFGLAFESESANAGPPVQAELDSYRASATLATIFAIAGSVSVLLFLGLTIFSLVLPVFRGSDDHPGRAGAGLIWLIASLLVAATTIIGLFLIRSVVLVIVDAARRLRALERDSLSQKSK